MNTTRNVRFVLEVDSGDDALTADPFGELHTMLGNAVEKVRTGNTMGLLWDSNGNRVGSWKLVLEKGVAND